MLSIVLNTAPMPLDTYRLRKEGCVCGHPWLETAHEDYILWRSGERDGARQTLRGYLSVFEWISHRKLTMGGEV